MITALMAVRGGRWPRELVRGRAKCRGPGLVTYLITGTRGPIRNWQARDSAWAFQ